MGFPKKNTPGDSACGIVRVSSKKQLDNNSPGVQRSGIEAYAKANNLKLLWVEEFHESAKKSADRKKFHALIERARKEGIRNLVFWVWDRTTRNATDQETMEENIRDDVFVMHIAFEGKVLHRDSPESDWLTADFSTMFARQYSRDLRRRATESMRAKAERGWFPTRAPLGYVNRKLLGEDGQILDKGGTIELTDWGRKLVRRMADIRLAGHSLETVATMVLDEGIVPPKALYRFKGNGRKSGVERVLKDRFYKGEFEWGGKVYVGKHEPVFTKKEWDAIQETFGRRAPQQHRKSEGLFSLPGFRLTCAECGCTVVYSPKWKGKNEYKYYRCTNGKRLHEKEVNIAESDILEQLGGAVDDIGITDDLATAIADAMNVTHRQAQAAKRHEADQIPARGRRAGGEGEQPGGHEARGEPRRRHVPPSA